MAITRSTTSVMDRLQILTAPTVRQGVGIVAFAVLTALSARVSLPIPGTAIPFTFGPLAVLLAGGLLGARLGAASQTLYLLAGLVGLPVFVLGSILAPSGGYLMAYPFAAFVVGALAGGSAFRTLGALVTGLVVIYAGGVAWLSFSIGVSDAIVAGVLPFLLADLVKVALAWLILLQMQTRSRALFGA